MPDAEVISLADHRRRRDHPAGNAVTPEVWHDPAWVPPVDFAADEDFTLVIGTLKVSTTIGQVTDDGTEKVVDQVVFRAKLRLRALAEELEDMLGVKVEWGVV